MFESLANHAWLAKILSHFFTYGSLVVLLSWISALAGAAITFVVRSDHGYRKTFRNFLTFCFPAEILRNRSCRLDALFLIATRFLSPLIIAPLLVASAAMTQVIHDGLTEWFGSRPPHASSFRTHVLTLLVVVVLADLINFLGHYLDHKVRVLWEFHKVHHAARFLIPITNRRVHPVQELFDDTLVSIMIGTWLGLISYLSGTPIEDSVFWGMDAYFFANLLSFYHLRHSHIPMSYGWLENILMSPAQHQLHHSFAVRHCDRNFGLLLSCWDKMAGTFVPSEAPSAILLGLPAQYERSYDTLPKLYLTPFVNVVRMLRGAKPERPDPFGPKAPDASVNSNLRRETSGNVG